MEEKNDQEKFVLMIDGKNFLDLDFIQLSEEDLNTV